MGRVLRSAAVPEGSVVFSCLDGLGTSRPGACAELAVVRDTALTVLPEGLDPVRAAAIGTPGLAAWFPLTRLTQVTPDDTVVVLGATGAVGKIAIQTAKLRGARSIVGVGRNQDRLASARSLGASAVVGLDASVDLPADLRTACEEPPTIVFDPLWGRPLLAALEVAATHARVIQLGQSSAPDLSLPSALVRGKSLKSWATRISMFPSARCWRPTVNLSASSHPAESRSSPQSYRWLMLNGRGSTRRVAQGQRSSSAHSDSVAVESP